MILHFNVALAPTLAYNNNVTDAPRHNSPFTFLAYDVYTNHSHDIHQHIPKLSSVSTRSLTSLQEFKSSFSSVQNYACTTEKKNTETLLSVSCL